VHPPDLQSVIIVDGVAPLISVVDFNEAVQVNFDSQDEIPPEALIDRALEAVRPDSFIFEERRYHSDWNASGPYIQELLVQVPVATVASLTATAITEAIRSFSRRRNSDTPKKPVAKQVTPIADAEVAWRRFSKFLNQAFKVSNTMAVDVSDTGSDWSIHANGDGYRFEGTVTKDGRILRARRVD
jgi:hypothetical protein